jgi:tetratricopeptide (TPR) repeat protein
MSVCPSPSQIQEFIEKGSFAEEFTTHIDTCEHCVGLVVQLCEQAEGNDSMQFALADKFAESLLQVDQKFLSRIAMSYPQDGLAAPSYREETIHDNIPSLDTIRFPGPPSDIGLLGRIDSFHVISKIGSGGFGEVYLAFDEKFSREVALKVLRTSVSEASYLARFKREAQSAGSIRHENVVMHLGMLEPTTDFPHACLILEYVQGGSLKKLMKAEQLFEVDQAVQWIIQAAHGLAAVHSKGVIHRDVKPGNLLMGEGGKIKLSDFGLARETRLEGDVSVNVAGTPPYMSPEQIQTPDRLSFETDIYSLGVVFYELLTGSRPFRGNDVALRRQIVHDEPTPLRQLNPQVPLDLETICLRALQKEPSRRFETANDFADDLQRWLDGRPIASRPTGRVEKAYMWARRSPELASLCLLMFATAALSLGAAIWISQLRKSEAKALIAAKQNALEARKQRDNSLETMRMMVTDLGLVERIGTHEALIALYPKVNEQLEEMNSGAAATLETQHSLAISSFKTADIYLAFHLVNHLTETLEKAKKHFQRSEMLLKSLPGDHRHELIKVYDGLGRYALRIGDLVAAQANFQNTLKIGGELLQEHPADTAIARDIAVVHESLGKVNVDCGKLSDGLEHYKASLAMRERLANTDDSSPVFQSDLASVLINYGIAIRPSDPATASSCYDRAVALYSKLVDIDSLNSTYLRGLARGYDHQGVGLDSAKRMAYVDKALEIREKLHRLDPLNRATLNDLIVSYILVAQHSSDPMIIGRKFDLALERANYWAQWESRDPQPLKYVARVNLGYGKMRREEMKLVEAREFASEAINIRRKIVGLSPIAFNITSLVVALKELADIAQQLEEFEPALKNLDEALECLQKLKKAQELLPQYEAWIPELVGQREDVLRHIADGGKGDSVDRAKSIQ